MFQLPNSFVGHLPRSAVKVTLATLLFLLLAAGGCTGQSKPVAGGNAASPRSEDPAAAMRAAIRSQQWDQARKFASQALIASPDDPEVLTAAATAAAMGGDRRQGARLLAEAAIAADFQPPSRVDHAVQALVDVGEVYNAIELIEQSLRVHPDNHSARRTLVGFLGEVQRPDLALLHYQRVVRDRQFDAAMLVGMTDMSMRRFSVETAEVLKQRNPSDHRVRLAEAQSRLDDRDTGAARLVLEQILKHHPDFAPAHAMLGQVLVADGRSEEIPQWAANRCAESRKQCDYWLTLGDWAAERNRHVEAARAYWEAARRSGDHGKAWARLADVLRILQLSRSGQADVDRERADRSAAEVSLDHATLAAVLEDCRARADRLLELREGLERFAGSQEKSQRVATEIAQTLLDLGRNWEAEAWLAVATTLKEEPSQQLQHLRRQAIETLKRDRDWFSKQGHPVLAVDLSRLPEPEPSQQEGIEQRDRDVVLPDTDDTAHFLLADETDSRGFLIPHSIETPRVPLLIHSMGSGGGAIDYELDGAADVIVAAAGGSMRGRDSAANVLLRNIDGRYQDVTEFAEAGDTGFCQGIAVGDYNEDGFPDLFFANLGQNRLLRNNGDGTFTDASDRISSDLRQWTTCGAFIDLNQDGITDLVSVNYCDANAGVDQPCLDPQAKQPVSCHPVRFPGHSDQLFRGERRGGGFTDVTSDWLPGVSAGRGLGILAGAMDGRQIGVFIANDMSANHYFSRGKENAIPLQESATVRGIAVDARTLSQASMGIASGDFDGDGDLDFYVTGFAREYNIYYRQQTPGHWIDDTARQGLVEPTLMTVGFGTEAIDLDSDGIDELVVTNGHIGDFGDDSPPQAQPMQLFRLASSGRYQSIDVASWNDYMAKPHIGRALWTFDADGDGRNDVVITHENEPPRLLINRTRTDHHHFSLRLVGTRDARDAVGAVVRFDCGGRKRTLWSLAGDGYMCSNQPILRAGLGANRFVENLTVTWPDGTADRIGRLEAGAEYLIVQGSGEAF